MISLIPSELFKGVQLKPKLTNKSFSYLNLLDILDYGSDFCLKEAGIAMDCHSSIT